MVRGRESWGNVIGAGRDGVGGRFYVKSRAGIGSLRLSSFFFFYTLIELGSRDSVYYCYQDEIPYRSTKPENKHSLDDSFAAKSIETVRPFEIIGRTRTRQLRLYVKRQEQRERVFGIDPKSPPFIIPWANETK